MIATRMFFINTSASGFHNRDPALRCHHCPHPSWRGCQPELGVPGGRTQRRKVIDFTGTYLVTKAFLPAMLDNRWGRVVNMSSVSAQRGGGVFGKVPYSSAKAAILGFTKALAREIADTGVTVNAVAPGAVDTNIRVGSTDEQEDRLARDIPIGRTASTDEIAAVITFLSSEDASYLTGTTVDINGGSHIH
jgi:2-hydroxycyclohexanecarboxyl-CoA dehydrogenase